MRVIFSRENAERVESSFTEIICIQGWCFEKVENVGMQFLKIHT